MSSIWNHNISVSIFGESQGPAIGVVIDNLPSGEYIDTAELLNYMARRAPKKDGKTTFRGEMDMPQIMSGIYENRTTGTPLCAFIQNTESQSQELAGLSKLARPGHADYTGALRYRGFNDFRDGGHSSGKLTASLVFAGAVCSQILERRSIYVGAHILEIHNIRDDEFKETGITRDEIVALRKKKFPVINDEQGKKMLADINKAKDSLDSLGGIIEATAINVPAGVGSPIFDGLENQIAQLAFGLPGVMGIEFGAGFKSAKMTGSQHNDEFYVDDHGYVLTKTNNHGGILGGISSGMPINARIAFKPNPSIAKPQKTIDYSAMKNETINMKGYHDPCIVPRAVPCVESVMNIAILSNMLDYPNF